MNWRKTMTKPNITYIIPLHKKDERVFRAIASVPKEDTIIISTTKEIKTWLRNKMSDDNGDIGAYFTTSDKSSYPTLVNAGILLTLDFNKVTDGELDCDLISILEFDDTVTPNANNIITQYYNDWDDVDIFAPVVCMVKENDTDKPILIGIANEAPMAPNVSEEFGTFTYNMMLKTNFLFVNGCYIRPSVFVEHGVFKENFKLFYDYEWALRVIYSGVITKCVPKTTRFHYLYDDSAFETQKATDKQTLENWLSAAKQEYFFDNDREICFD